MSMTGRPEISPNQRMSIRAASQWVARLGGMPLTAEEEVAFQSWLDASPEHKDAFEKVRAVWVDFGSLRTVGDIQSPARRRNVFGLRRVITVAAACLLVVVGTAYWVGNPFIYMMADYRTAPGEILRVVLPDGSIANLNSKSAIALKYSEDERRIELLAGEAYFTTAPVNADERRPFVIEFGPGRARALGTQFDVAITDAGGRVIVAEHKVEVSLASDTAIVGEGQAVGLQKGAGLSNVEPVNPTTIGAWRRDRLIFDGVTLADIVRELNRHTRESIVIADRDKAQRKVGGVFKVTDIDQALDVLAAELQMKVARVPGIVAVLH